MKNLKRASVLGGIILGLMCMASVEAWAQGNGKHSGNGIGSTTLTFDYDWGGLSALRTYVASLVAQIEASKVKIAQLETALSNEITARQTGDAALQNAVNGISGGGVTQAALNAAIAAEAAAREAADTAEANARATADAALEGQIANEVADRQALGETVAGLGETVAPLASLAPLAPLATYVSVQTGALNGLAGPHVIFSGANVHIQNGAAGSLIANGRGNLIVGYNEPFDPLLPAERAGSHNVVIGVGHRYDFATGLVNGYGNRLGNRATGVTGGGNNEALDFAASVTGGSNNRAVGMYSTVTAGDSNNANGSNAAVHGGSANDANGDLSAVSGGFNNTASAPYSVVP